MIAIVDYGVGNLFSIASSLKYLEIESVVTNDAEVLRNASHIILPGVGAFGDAMEKLRGVFEEARKQNDFGNGRFVRNILEQAKMNQASRLLEKDFDSITADEITTITAEDIVIPETTKPKKRQIGFC